MLAHAAGVRVVHDRAAPAVIAVAVVLLTGGVARAADGAVPGDGPRTALSWYDDLRGRDTLTGNGFGLGERLSDRGVSAALCLTQVYQANLHGGRATGRHAGRYTGAYGLTLDFDLGKLLRLGVRLQIEF